MVKEAFLNIVKVITNIAAFLYLLFRTVHKKRRVTQAIPVFMSVKKGHLMLAYLAISSISRFFDNLEFHILLDYKTRFLDKFVLKRIGLNVSIVSDNDSDKLELELKNHKWCSAFYNIGWQGKKFFAPLLFKKYGKVLVLDCDTLFFNEPQELKRWLVSGKKSIYMEDCGNYTVVSPVEAATIFKRQSHIKNLNCGLLGLDLRDFWDNNSLRAIDKYIKAILEIECKRQVSVNRTNVPYGFTDPLVEQTLWWLTLDNSGAKTLSDNYFLIGRHILNEEKIGNPVFIHFAGDVNKKTLYYYLFNSLTEWIINKVQGKLQNDNPWYTYSTKYCYNCRLGKRHIGYTRYNGPQINRTT